MIWWLRTPGRTVISDNEKLNAHFFMFVVLVLFLFLFFGCCLCLFANFFLKYYYK